MSRPRVSKIFSSSRIRVKNPEPLNNPEWGPISNRAYVLVPFSFTTHWSQNKDVGDFQK